MDDVVIRAVGVSKSYRVGAARTPYKTLRESLAGATRALWAKLATRDRAAAAESTFWALKDVGFEIRCGEAVGIIGRNGAGKSTLLKILARITEPTAGLIELRGRVGSLLEVGTGFHPELTGRENVYLNGAILGMRRHEINDKFKKIVEFSEIEKFLDTPVKHYSSGMYTRLAFAVAAHLEPEILIVDEVLAVGDMAFQKKCLGLMDEVAHQGRTVLFVSHNMGAISQLCQRCILLKGGAIASAGPTNEVVLQYLNQDSSTSPTVDLAPANTAATFRSVGMLTDTGEPSVTFDVRRGFDVWMRFELKEPIRGLQVSLEVFNHKGDRIFYHSNAYADSPLLTEEPGVHALYARVPAMVLVPGSYSINVALHVPNVQMFDLRESVILFAVEETGSGRHEYPAGSIGCVFVDIAWRTLK